MTRRVRRDSWNAGLPGRLREKSAGSAATGPNARFTARRTALIPDVFRDVRKSGRETVRVVGGVPIGAVVPVLVEHRSADGYGIGSGGQGVDRSRVSCDSLCMRVVASG